jgi:hypothetical protein
VVLTLLSAALVAGALAVSARWWLTRVDAIGRRRPYPLLAVVSLVELAVVSIVPVLRLIGEEHRLSRVASYLVGAPATVHCQSLSASMIDTTDELGHVNVVGGVLAHSTQIKNEQCHLVARYVADSKANPGRDEVVAVHVLTHESMHMRGILDEARAECAAVQRDELTAEQLGATPDEARALAVRYWLTVYPWMPDAYKTRDCGPGQELDEHLPTAPWAVAPAQG